MANTYLQLLKEQDIYSLILFILAELRSVPDYAILSELIYILDKETLLKLCEYFGGQTITIPTIEDIEHIIYSLILYEKVDIKHENIDYVLNSFNSKNKRQIKSDYYKLKTVLDDYEFKPR